MCADSLLFDGKRFLQMVHDSFEVFAEPTWLRVRLAGFPPSFRVHLTSRFRLDFSFWVFGGSVGFCKFNAGMGGGLMAFGCGFSSKGFASEGFAGIIVIVVVGGIDIGREIGLIGMGVGRVGGGIFSLFFFTRIFIIFLSVGVANEGGSCGLITSFDVSLLSKLDLLQRASGLTELRVQRKSRDRLSSGIYK